MRFRDLVIMMIIGFIIFVRYIFAVVAQTIDYAEPPIYQTDIINVNPYTLVNDDISVEFESQLNNSNIQQEQLLRRTRNLEKSLEVERYDYGY